MKRVIQCLRIISRWLLPPEPVTHRPEDKRMLHKTILVYPGCTCNTNRWSIAQINRSIELDSTKPRVEDIMVIQVSK